jgi:hypothetical protein
MHFSARTEYARLLAFTVYSVYNTSTMTQGRETKGRGADAPGSSARDDLRAMLGALQLFFQWIKASINGFSED